MHHATTTINTINLAARSGGKLYCGGGIPLPCTVEEGVGLASKYGMSWRAAASASVQATGDHLGNNRVLFSDRNGDGAVDSTEIIQENHYYAFGLEMKGSWQRELAPEQRYGYNGKEHIEEIGLMDYGARWYDPAIARWTSIDPIASDYASMSPYSYVANNPLLYVDPDGMRLNWFQYNQETGKYDRVNYDQLDATTQEALQAFAQTEEGFAFLSDFAEEGDAIGDVTFAKGGRFAESDLSYTFDSNVSGGSTFPAQIDGKTADFSVRIGTKDKSVDEVAVTLGHETFTHLDQFATDFADQCRSGCVEDALRIQSEHQENNRQGVDDHRDYLNGSPSQRRFSTFINQLSRIRGAGQVSVAKKKLDDKLRKHVKSN